ncbi:MAG: penicillin-binding protein 1B [Gammaproteobacteria bacterium]|nr:penicillin-binding protein 1B [Gammaproteobacteria bacterium]MCW8987825.1 penicillin-binding protein 1B [Gammaproteobacteria bacterium]
MKRKSPLRRKKKSSSKKQSHHSKTQWFQNLPLMRIFLVILGIFVIYVIYLDYEVRSQFDGRRWSVPARVYARPLELYIGKPLSHEQFNYELKRSEYRLKDSDIKSGDYQRSGDSYRVVVREFDFWDGHQPPRYIQIKLEEGFVTEVTDFRDQTEVDIVRLEPAVIGRIYPSHREDRMLVKLDDVPESLITALLSVEDRDFYSHYGVNPKAIVRAIFANIKAGAVVQGGSTLTQQLVKNFFLTKKKSLVRKFNEAIMAFLLEAHYEKKEILEAYLNEIYLGQDKKRAIHGFGLASRFYFDKPIYNLELSEIATLVAMVKGPSYYDPWKYKDRNLERRNVVINLMHQSGAITNYEALEAKSSPSKVIKRSKTLTSDYPAYMDLLRRQLQQDYDKEDLTSEGLQIFSTFDPYIQNLTEQAVKSKVKRLDQQYNMKGTLQSAVIVTNTNNADVLAVVGDKQPTYAGFNRALDAMRPVGSLIKPAVYLTAIQQKNYSLVTKVEDKAITLKAEDGNLWSPRNYTAESHGEIPLYKALISSYNQATVRLGLELGFEPIVKTLRNLGIQRDIPPYPSMLLGAVTMTPFEITQMYQTLSAEGFITPLHTIRKVLTAKGEPLKHYPVKIKQGIDETSVRIINSALHEATRHGTASSMSWRLPKGLKVAGKTGTTNDTRDSWFAGFSGEHLIVTWLGTDDNNSTGLTGASGALPIWTDIMKKIRTRPLSFAFDDQLEFTYVEPTKGLIVDESCSSAAYLAFRKGQVPEDHGRCPD